MISKGGNMLSVGIDIDKKRRGGYGSYELCRIEGENLAGESYLAQADE